MADKLSEPKGWNPYLAGALAGLLLVFPYGLPESMSVASTTFVRAAGFVEGVI